MQSPFFLLVFGAVAFGVSNRVRSGFIHSGIMDAGAWVTTGASDSAIFLALRELHFPLTACFDFDDEEELAALTSVRTNEVADDAGNE